MKLPDRNGALQPDQLTLPAVIRRLPILGTGCLKADTASDLCGVIIMFFDFNGNEKKGIKKVIIFVGKLSCL
ncbi:MAG: hypothetical protein RSF68_00190 [Myroides sp.]